MHTTEINQTRFHHNSDFSGDVIIGRAELNVVVPMEDLKSFFAEYLEYDRLKDRPDDSGDVTDKPDLFGLR